MPPRRTPAIVPPQSPPTSPLDEFGDDLTADEVEQLNVGSLFSIQGAEFENVSWSVSRFRNRAEKIADPDGPKEDWVLDVTGELKGAELQPLIGGGTFRFRGYVPRSDGRGVRLAYNRILSLAGHRKALDAFGVDVVATATPTPPPAAPPVPAAPDMTSVLMQMLLGQQQQFGQLVVALVGRPEQKSTDIDKLLGGLESLDRMRGSGESESDRATAMLTLLRQGIDIGTTREPIPAGGVGEDQASWVPQALDIVRDMLAQRRGRSVATPTTSRPTSSATVIPDRGPRSARDWAPPADGEPAPRAANGAAAAPDPGPPGESVVGDGMPASWVALAEAAMNEIAAGTDPADFAGTVETMLAGRPIDLLLLRNASVEQAMDRLRPAHPAFRTAEAEAWVAKLLDELRKPPADE